MNDANDPYPALHRGKLPLDHAFIDELLACLHGYSRIAIAVSGGADSIALMRLVDNWSERHADARPDLFILTVDHGLRLDAADEARWVAGQAMALGLPHQTLKWDGAKPTSGVQAMARLARYRLLSEYCRHHGIEALLTAHTRDDQAETVAMRLSRGSGVDGLSAMAPMTRLADVDLLRPLLRVSRARLEAYLTEIDQNWLEDPSNRDNSYERVRVRQALRASERLGIGRASLARTARRMRRARAALDQWTTDFMTANLTVHDAGYGEIAHDALRGVPEEIALRAFGRLLRAFGGGHELLRLSKIEQGLARLMDTPKGLTLGGCEIVSRQGRFVVTREAGRLDAAPVPIVPGSPLRWDNRFEIALPDAAASDDLRVRPLLSRGLASLRAAGGSLAEIPHAAAITLPSIWSSDGTLRYAPFGHFETKQPDCWLSNVSVTFSNRSILLSPSKK